jgi:hypothetical protein
LGKVPALIYLLGYLVVIYIFSLIYYYVLPESHFYHSTTQYEYELFKNDEYTRILHDLGTEISGVYQKNGQANLEVNDWRIVTDNLGAANLYIGNLPSDFSFEISIPINNGTEGNWDSWTFLLAKVTIFTDGKYISNDIVYSPFKMDKLPGSPVQGIPDQIPSPGIEFPYKQFDQQELAPVLPLSLNLYNRVIEYWQWLGLFPKAFPSGESNRYSQMLYFSAGIATSSALGDILPISRQARSAVTSETIIVVIFIGLFLNSLAYGIGETLKSAQKVDQKMNRIVSDTNNKRPTKRATSQKKSKTRNNHASRQNPKPPRRR